MGKRMAVLLLLFSVGALLLSSDAQQAYDRLPGNFKKGVDLALKKLNASAEIQHHLLFFRGILRSDIEADDDIYYNFYHFYLKATNCSKGAVDTAECQFSIDGPLVDCAICYKTVRGKIQRKPKPYVKCVPKTALTEKMKARRIYHCNKMGSVTGAPPLATSDYLVYS